MRTRLLLVVLAVAGALLASQLDQGWFPHDEGALGQAAERVLAGEVPHRDFDEIYTGLLTYLHAAAFKVGGHASTTLRIPLFLFAMAWVAALYQIALRFAPPVGAAFVAITAFVWSVPNYPAPMPSWYNLFFATFGTLALLKATESRDRRWLVLAGAAGGLSFLFKLSGIFFLLGGGLALIVASHPRLAAGEPRRADASAAAGVVSFFLLGILVALGVPIARAGNYEFARFVLPLALLITALILREWSEGGTGLRERSRALLGVLGPFALGAAIPVGVYVLFLAIAGALPATIDGVLITPFRRVHSASVRPPASSAIIYAMVLGLLLVPRVATRTVRVLAVVAAALLGLLVWSAGDRVASYRVAWLAAWGLPAFVALGATALVRLRIAAEDSRASAAVMMSAIALCAVLVEFPFAAPIYTLYAIPLTFLALTAVVRAGGRTPLSLQLVVAGFLLAFGLFRVIPATVDTLGHFFRRTDEVARLDLPRGGLRVTPRSAAWYKELVGAVEELAPGRTMWAGPDAPEVYFLSGVQNQTRTMFDFLDVTTSSMSIVERVHAADASLVVLQMLPSFATPPDAATVAALQAEFPNSRRLPRFLLLWR